MKRVAIIAGICVTALLGAAGMAAAQEGCRQVRQSCSTMFKECERRCQSGNNPSACVARTCSTPFNGCKANGVWRSVVTGSACWSTTDRS